MCKDFKKKIPLEQRKQINEIIANKDKYYEQKNKKAFFNCINDISYNFKDLILSTWKLLQSKDNIEDELLIDENYDYNSSDEEN